jgi:16S rRNA (uracil1498-N3)-methyltransferase
VERGDREGLGGVTTLHAAGALKPGARVTLSEAAAHHARVRRLAVGDPVRLTTGSGEIASGTIAELAKSRLEVGIDEVRAIPAPPAIHLFVPVADRDRMLWLAEKATELAIASWHPVRFHRSRSVSPRGEGTAFAEKVRARMVSALEQSGGAWLPVIHPEVDLAALLTSAPAGQRYLLDVAGESLFEHEPHGAASLILGPEGGLEQDERSQLIQVGWIPASLALTTLRFETAGIAATALLRAMLSRSQHAQEA